MGNIRLYDAASSVGFPEPRADYVFSEQPVGHGEVRLPRVEGTGRSPAVQIQAQTLAPPPALPAPQLQTFVHPRAD